MSHVPHVWEPVGFNACVLPGAERLVRRPPTDLICRRCGTVLRADMAPAFDRIPGWQDCDHMLAVGVMES